MTLYLDLERGFMVLRGTGRDNIWQTGIECALEKTDARGETRIAWLAHECRSEQIAPRIFDDRGTFEAVAVKGWNESVFLRSGSYNYSLNPVRPDQPTYERGTLEIQTHCELRKAREITFAETLALFLGGGASKVYMSIEYEKDSCQYRLYAPCRYMNYSAPESDKRYIQPISGYVLFEDAGKFSIAYVAAHVRETETSVEFCLRERRSFIKTKPNGRGFHRLSSWLDFLVFRFFFVTDEFTRIERQPSAKCTFFVYSE